VNWYTVSFNMIEHEYSVLGGPNRAAIGRTLSLIAAAASSILVALALAAIDLARTLGLSHAIPQVVLWPLTAGLIYAGLYWLFDQHVWKLPRLSKLLRVPDLSGTWLCRGQTLKPDGSPEREWTAEVAIVQSWDRLRVRLKTPQSTSNSIAAALVYDQADGYRLLYNYRNEPRIGQPQLAGHRGSAELLFSQDLQSAKGEYFNGHGRYTFGTIQLERKAQQ
jgi:SMODS-associating 2TM, beta-strand rich effector domain